LFESNAPFLPPFSERYRPVFLFSVSTIANTLFEFALETLIPILPIDLGNPSASFCQVFPFSVYFQIAAPDLPLEPVL